MTNWKVFKIIDKKISSAHLLNFVDFELDGYVIYEKGKEVKNIRLIFDEKDSSINSYQVGDYLEINMDETVNHNEKHFIPFISPKAKNLARKFGSSAVVSSSSSNQQITSNQIQERDERMRRWVEESGGEYEVDFIARQEYRTDGSIGAHELKWTYRKK